MKVLKFGGTSMGSIESLKNVKSIIDSQTSRVVVVVSAMSGVTDTLLNMVHKAEVQDHSYELTLQQLYQRHLSVIDGVVPAHNKQACIHIIDKFINEGLPQFLGTLYTNKQLDEAVKTTLEDAIVSHGEILSSAILTHMLQDVEGLYAPHFIKTQDIDGERILDNSTFDLAKQAVAKCQATVMVTQGFIAQDINNNFSTNLGRGGSDFTAAIIAAAIDAQSLEIWTDVDGFYSADPKKDPNAKLLDKMTYRQAIEMCEAGAKVIYAPTLSPVALKHIPVRVKNTFNPTARGTLIAHQP